ncbi:MAG: hypothetical protein M0P91_03980 [Sulfuricurvum sp.]|jgi:hypothetical protein|uniref:hypothetical protein n=1 Tax=Sulfuricurvum sp. TaxID=2025608 RepID=UPI0025F6FDD3|nr:hypothetical protein [Sulfuricurvum sp.]MCK9372331.1 hypothetical protein [Sulfuricurvum sp.]
MSFGFLIGSIAGIIAGFGVLSFTFSMVIAVGAGFIFSMAILESPVLAMAAYLGVETVFHGSVTQYGAGIVAVAIVAALINRYKAKKEPKKF